MKRSVVVLAALAVVAVALIAVIGASRGWFQGLMPGTAEAAAAGASTPDALRVDVVRPVRRTVIQPAQVEPWEKVELIPKIAGYLRDFAKDLDGKPIDTGSRVKAGQVLATLSAPEVEAELRVKEASLSQAQEAVRAAIEQQRVAETDRDKYQAELEFRDAELKRHQRLFSEGSIQRDQLDEKINQHKAAKAALNNSVARISLTQAELKVAESRVNVALFDKQRAADLFAYTTLSVPAAGDNALYIVTRRWVDPGAYVQPSSGGSRDALLSLMRVDRVRVATDQLPELDSPFVEVGDKATFEAASLPGRFFEGTVSRLSFALQLPSRTMRVEVDMDNPKGRPLYPGMYGVVKLTLGLQKGAWLLPPAAIRKSGAETFVYAVADGKLEQLPVSLGVNDGRMVEVLKGVFGETQVVRQVFGNPVVGQPVTVIAGKK